MRRLLSPLLVLLLLALAAVVLPACGGGDEGDDAQSIVKETFSGDKDIKSGRLDLSLGFKATAGQSASQGPVSLKLTGPFQSQGKGQLPKFDLNASIAGGGQQLSVGAVSTGQKGFIKAKGSAYAVPPDVFDQFKQGFEQAQAKSSQDKGKTTLGGLGIDPLTWLRDPKVQGDEQVGGVDTRHVSAGVDVSKFLDDVNKFLQRASGQGGTAAQQLPQGGLTAEQKQQIASAVKNPRFDVWSGKDDKVLRKLTVTLDVQAPKGQAAGGATSGSVDFSLTLSDLNKAQTITEPANPKSFQELEKLIQGLDLGQLGGLGGGSGGLTPGGSGGSGGSSGSQAYVDCIQKAAGDVGEAQKCARLLQP